LWTAERIYRGAAKRIPSAGEPEHDQRGLHGESREVDIESNVVSRGVGFGRRPLRTCKMDLVHRTSSILISYRHGPLLGAYLGVI
jgi:hypothetical protein